MLRRALIALAITLSVGALALNLSPATEASAQVGRTMVWAGCEMFESIVTPASFPFAHGQFDELYAGAMFSGGAELISDAHPGDPDYNGGRWHLNRLREGVDPNKYSFACSVEDIDPNDFESTDTYFECPLLPRRGGGRP